MYRRLSQFGDAVNVPEFVPGEAAKLALDRSDAFLEPDSRNLISITVHGSDANWNDRFLLIV
jgi:hypothetical protein